ncbi:MAG: C25 family cysteine peptidase [Planctomycetota bacterium]|jgi:hypothetical protein
MNRKISLFTLIAGLMVCSMAIAHEGQSYYEQTLSYSDLDRTVIHFTLQGFEQETVSINGSEYVTIHIPGSAYFKNGEAGQPQLPRVSESVMIPDTAMMDVKVLKSEYYEIEDMEIAPSKGTIMRTVDPASVPYLFGPEYGQNAFLPGQIAEARNPFILRDVRGLTVDIHPFQYNPVTNVLRVYTSIDVEVAVSGMATENILDRSKVGNKPCASFEMIYSNFFGNYAGNREDPPSEEGDLLIISHGPFMSAVQPLVDWKNSIGINTTMVDVATIGNNSTAIANYIKSVYNSSNLAFVLLVGDANEVKSMPYSYTVSDPDYTTITADWYPDLLIGRFSAQTTAHVETQVERTVAYEMEGHDVGMGGWNAAALGVASNQGAGAGHYGESDDQHVDLMMDELTDYGFTTITKSYDYWGTTTIIKNALNDGVRTVQYTGHGWSGGWGNGGGMDNNDVDNLINTGMLPFVVSVACNVGEFDSGTCFCEAWMRATHSGEPTGSIAHYGSSVSQSWAPPMYGQGNHCIGNKYGAIDRFFMNMNWSIGCEWFGGSCCMMELAGSGGRDMFRTWIVFGDPSLRIFGAAGPQTLMADGFSIPVSTPTQINFTICPGEDYAGYNYVLLSGVTGTTPGSVLPGGLEVPLNFDVWTSYLLGYMHTLPYFTDFSGVLDSMGEATATLSTTGATPLDPRLVGDHLYFAAVAWPAGKPYEVATNAKVLTFVE